MGLLFELLQGNIVYAIYLKCLLIIYCMFLSVCVSSVEHKMLDKKQAYGRRLNIAL